jgi:LmbE family N-acetylglucosaminyl deacetylase
MLQLIPDLAGAGPLRLMCIGAHSDDLEIGCGGTVLTLLAGKRPVSVDWVVLSAAGARKREAGSSARALLRGAAESHVATGDFRDSFFVAEYARLKEHFEGLKSRPAPHIVFTHRLEDRHQDHRLVAELTWNSFRDHLVVEYEIAKYEGDLGAPNAFVPLSRRIAGRKASHLVRHFGSQRSKPWFSAENFLALARVRGLECRARDGFAEAFHVRKMVLGGGG